MNTEKISREYNKNDNKKTEVVNIRISKKQKKQINDIRAKLGLNQSEILRLAIENIVSQNQENNR